MILPTRCRPPTFPYAVYGGPLSPESSIPNSVWGCMPLCGGQSPLNPIGPVLVPSVDNSLQLHLVSMLVHYMPYANLLHLPHTHMKGNRCAFGKGMIFSKIIHIMINLLG